jgi:predicted small metal-binding protein
LIEKVSAAIGWEPAKSLDEILDDVIQHTRTAPVLEEAAVD